MFSIAIFCVQIIIFLSVINGNVQLNSDFFNADKVVPCKSIAYLKEGLVFKER